MDLEGTLEGLLSVSAPQNQPRSVYFWVHLGFMKVQECSLVQIIDQDSRQFIDQAGSRLPRIPWNIFWHLEKKNIVDTANFLLYAFFEQMEFWVISKIPKTVFLISQ